MRGSTRDERRLRQPAAFAGGKLLVDLRQPFGDRFLRQALQVQVERRVDVDGGVRLQQPGVVLLDERR